jgi:hypothetical protein
MQDLSNCTREELMALYGAGVGNQPASERHHELLQSSATVLLHLSIP